MNEVFVGSEVLSRSGLTRSRLRWNYRSIYPDVYVLNDVTPSLRQHTMGGSGRVDVASSPDGRRRHSMVPSGCIRGRPSNSSRPRPAHPRGIVTRDELISADELVLIEGMAVTNPARTAFDLARHLHRDLAVRYLDALARATGIEAADVLALVERYRRARGRGRCALALDLMDGRAQSPKETALRLLVMDEGFHDPAPRSTSRTASTTRSSTWGGTSQ